MQQLSEIQVPENWEQFEKRRRKPAPKVAEVETVEGALLKAVRLASSRRPSKSTIAKCAVLLDVLGEMMRR